MDKYSGLTPYASLTAVGIWMCRKRLWSVVKETVEIKQKVIKHTPAQKLLDCFVNVLAGGTGLVEINTRLRPDRPLQRAFGRADCAEQSTVSDTLDACTKDNVAQMRQAVNRIMEMCSQCMHHDYARQWQLLDVDVTGMPVSGRQGEGVTGGYYPNPKHRRGRQLGRVLATWYDEIVVDELYEGKRQLNSRMPQLVEAAEEALALDAARRARTILRLDGGAGSDSHINWILERGYHLLVKSRHWQRTRKRAAAVNTWIVDPKDSGRELAWIETPHPYARPTRQIVVRTRRRDGSWAYSTLVFSLTDEMLFLLCARRMPQQPTPSDVLIVALHAYDRRGGGVETQIRGDKQGLGLSRRNKRQFAAQEMLVLIAQLAHNVVIWTRNALAAVDPRWRKYGVQRTVRDVLQIPGYVVLDINYESLRIVLNRKHPIAADAVLAFNRWLDGDHVSFCLGEI